MTSVLSQSRACRACNALKVRCQFDAATAASAAAATTTAPDSFACDRCKRAGRRCVPAGRRRRPRERIAELEARIAELTQALQDQHLTTASASQRLVDDDGGDDPSSSSSLKTGRPGNPEASRSPTLMPSPDAVRVEMTPASRALASLDAHVPTDMQQRSLNTFLQDVFPTCPVVRRSVSDDVDVMRQEAPLLLLSIISFTTSYLLPADTRNQLLRDAMALFALELIARPRRQLEVVQALLVAVLWFRVPPGDTHVTLSQLLQAAISMAIDIGIGGPQLVQAPGSGGSLLRNAASLEARQAWLAASTCEAALSISLRRPQANKYWTVYHGECLEALKAPEQLGSDMDSLFPSIIQGQKLCCDAADAMALCDRDFLWDLVGDKWSVAVGKLRKQMDDWTAEVLVHAGHKPLLFYRYSTILLVNESVLHTATNKMTFAAPLQVEKFTENDFATAAVTGNHVLALHALKDSCHAMLDLALDPTMTPFLSTCPIAYVAMVSQALFILIKLYIAVTGSGNTYGSVLRPGELQLNEYLDRVDELTSVIEPVNPDSFNLLILEAHAMSRHWLKGYDQRVRPGVMVNSGAPEVPEDFEFVGHENNFHRIMMDLFPETVGERDEEEMWKLLEDHLPI